MTDETRRTFLGGAIAIAAASLIPVSAFAGPVPILWGDGEHDDADGLEALIAGKPFEVAGSGFVAKDYGDRFELKWGKFRLERPLDFPAIEDGRTGEISHNEFIMAYRPERLPGIIYGEQIQVHNFRDSGKEMALYPYKSLPI